MNFPFTCSIAKPSGSTNALNEDSTDYAAATAGYDCMYVSKMHSQVDPAVAQLVQVNEDSFIFPIGTDVQKGDQISDVLFQSGEVVTSRVFIVERSWEYVSPTQGRLAVIASVRSAT